MNARPTLGLPVPTLGLSVTPVAMTDPADEPEQPPMHNARDLTSGGTTAIIVLDGKSYILRITRAGKLILTK